jgi:CRISPR-associated protein Cmr6
MNSRRDRLVAIQVNADKQANAGLWLDKYIVEQSREQKDDGSRRRLIDEVATQPIPEIYEANYRRWEQLLRESGAKTRLAVVKGRTIVGLGSESVLETSIVLHRTYGVPYIPGSALKGLAANYARHRLGEHWQKGTPAYKVVFGDTDDAGYITFFDALYMPGSRKEGEKVLYPDIITVHHQKYYQDTGGAPTDKDNSNPVPLLSATGTYLIALAAPDLQRGDQWIDTTFAILEKALETLGIGAKTSSGYGRMKLLPTPLDPELKKVESYQREIESIRDSNVASQIQGYYQRWEKLESEEARRFLARVIVEKVRMAGRERETAGKQWYQTLQAFLGTE